MKDIILIKIQNKKPTVPYSLFISSFLSTLYALTNIDDIIDEYENECIYFDDFYDPDDSVKFEKLIMKYGIVLNEECIYDDVTLYKFLRQLLNEMSNHSDEDFLGCASIPFSKKYIKEINKFLIKYKDGEMCGAYTDFKKYVYNIFSKFFIFTK